MPATKLRVHTLAKELGVPSKVIIEKCAAEGVELRNHMAAISAGLAESIREWFSVGTDVTSVEQAAPVELEKVRKPRRLKQVEHAAEPEVVEGPTEEMVEAPAPTAPVPLPPPSDEPIAAPGVERPAAKVEEPIEAPEIVAPAEVGGTVPSVVPPAEVPVEAAPPVEAAEAPLAPPPLLEPPAPPPKVMPAGPQLVPKPAELQGPRVVRVEAPEPERPYRPRVGSLAARAPATSAGAAPTTDGTATRRPRGKGRKTTVEEDAVRARARSPRRHGTTVDPEQRLREWRDQDLLERKERLASVTGHGLRDRRAAERRRQTAQPGAALTGRRDTICMTVPIAMKDFCAAVGSPFTVVSRKLMEHTGQLWTINQSLNGEMVELLALELGVAVTLQRARTAYERLRDEFVERQPANLLPRPPVVAMLGHVDHGKTSLLDAIRKARVAEGEAGGITQHIGAYRIDRGDWHVTFVDTPGHQAFTAMRARGADLTDVVVLVVAADDGVMPQTIEAMNHARAAGVPIVVALNKYDLPGIDLNHLYAQLSEHDLAPTEWGGTTDVIKTSAVTGLGIDDLIAHLSTLSDLLELKADPDVPARATVIEAQMREGQGVVAQVLVREGTLRPGQFAVCGPGSGRVRALRNDLGQLVKEALPGTPVEVTGLDEMPVAGDTLYQVETLARAKEIAQEVGQQRRSEALQSASSPKPRTLEALVRGVDSEVVELPLIIRADVQGSVEVLRSAIESLPTDKGRTQLLQVAVGTITEADVHLAKASGAMIVGFHVVAEERARQLADQLGVEIRVYRVIYEVLDDLRKALSGLLEPVTREEQRGVAEVRQVFHVTRVGTIAGCYVTDGVVQRNHKVRLVRDGRIVLEKASIDSLKRFKDDAREVRAGMECGLKIEGFDDLKPGDLLQAFELVEVPQEV